MIHRAADYNADEFQRPLVPALPVPRPGAAARDQGPAPPGVLGLTHRRYLHSGRYALYHALRHAGLTPGDGVLVPAYHCLAMLEPLHILGLEPVFYPIAADTSVRTADLESRLTAGIAAVIVVHYFGVVQNLSAVRLLANRAKVWLIEDCSHALFGGTAEAPVGAVGDYAIASTMKFLPIGFGGLLASAQRDLTGLALQNPPLRDELKAAYNLLESALEYRRPALPEPLLQGRVDQPRQLTPNRGPLRPPAAAAREYQGRTEYSLDPHWLHRQATRVSRTLLNRGATQCLAERRRANYAAYLRAVRGRHDCHPLCDPLPTSTVPQVFPLYVNDCRPVFIALKRQRVPIIRFGEFLDARVTASICPVSIDYADHLLQFPCHQALTTPEVDWIIRMLISALDAAAGAQ